MLRKITLLCACFCLLVVGAVLAAGAASSEADPLRPATGSEAAPVEALPVETASTSEAAVADPATPLGDGPTLDGPSLVPEVDALPTDEAFSSRQEVDCCWDCREDCDQLFYLCLDDCAGAGPGSGCFQDCRSDRDRCNRWCDVLPGQ